MSKFSASAHHVLRKRSVFFALFVDYIGNFRKCKLINVCSNPGKILIKALPTLPPHRRNMPS